MVLEHSETCSIHAKAGNDYTELKLCQIEHINTH